MKSQPIPYPEAVIGQFEAMLTKQFGSEHPNNFSTDIFHKLFEWQPTEGTEHDCQEWHRKQGLQFLEIDHTEKKPTKGIRDLCWKILLKSLLYPDESGIESIAQTQDLPIIDLELEGLRGDIFCLTKNYQWQHPWHTTLLAAKYLRLPLLFLLLLWKGELFSQIALSEDQTDEDKQEGLSKYYSLDTKEEAKPKSRIALLFKALQDGEAFSIKELHTLRLYIYDFEEKDKLSPIFKEIIQITSKKIENLEHDGWPGISRTSPHVKEPPLRPSAVDSQFGSDSRQSEPAPALQENFIRSVKNKGPFIQNLLLPENLLRVIDYIEKKNYAKAMRKLEAETLSSSSSQRQQLILYLLLLRCKLNTNEFSVVPPILSFLWDIVRSYGSDTNSTQQAENILLFKWDPILVGELVRLTLDYLSRHRESQKNHLEEISSFMNDSELENLCGYNRKALEKIAFSAGFSFFKE